MSDGMLSVNAGTERKWIASLFAIATRQASFGGGGLGGQKQNGHANVLKQDRLCVMGVISLACVLMDVPRLCRSVT